MNKNNLQFPVQRHDGSCDNGGHGQLRDDHGRVSLGVAIDSEKMLIIIGGRA